MSAAHDQVFAGGNPEEFWACYVGMAPTLPRDIRHQLADVFEAYFTAYGLEGAYERMQGRPVAQVLAEYKQPESPPELPPVLAEGERDGLRYTLYDAPSTKKKGAP